MHEYEEGGQKLNPPEAKKLAGRPKKLRNRQADESRNPHKASSKNINRSYKNKLHPKPKMVKMSSKSQTRGGGQATSQPPMSTASIGLKRRSTRSSTQASSGLGKGPEITIGGRGRGPINAFASAVNVKRTGVNVNVRGHAVSITSDKELATGSKYTIGLHRIPPAFVAKMEGELPKNALIEAKSGEQSWEVKIQQIGDEHCFTHRGWEKLVNDNHLRFGDFVVFRLISDSMFHIVTYGPSGCEKELNPSIKKIPQNPFMSRDRTEERSKQGVGQHLPNPRISAFSWF
ncbi:hypothetical protein CsSME_00005733 [Camellia sinensis var. sinensis]